MFISIEGIEGTGKSTVAEALSNKLRQHSISSISTREPGGTDVAENIRKLALNTETVETILPEVELMLMFAARMQHVESKIKPELNAGKWVICDRFIDASYAYQGAGRNIPDARIAAIHKWSIADFIPDKTILLDMPTEIAFERVMLRNNMIDRIEQESLDFFSRVRARYLALAKAEPDRFLVIDATNSPKQVIDIIWQEALNWI